MRSTLDDAQADKTSSAVDPDHSEGAGALEPTAVRSGDVSCAAAATEKVRTSVYKTT